MTEKRRAYQLRPSTAGLCQKCRSAAVEGRTYCQRHLDYMQAYIRRSRGQA